MKYILYFWIWLPVRVACQEASLDLDLSSIRTDEFLVFASQMGTVTGLIRIIHSPARRNSKDARCAIKGVRATLDTIAGE